MFKKTLIAATLVGMSSTAMGAITIGEAALAPTPQFATTAPFVASGLMTAEVNANYAAGDTFSITFSQDVDSTQAFSTAVVNATAASCTDTDVAMSVTFAGYQASLKKATYTVQAVSGGSLSTISCNIPFPAVKFDGAAVAAADTVTATISSSKGYGVTESMAAAKELINVAATQFAVTSEKFNAVVDVSASRYTFKPVAADTVDLELTDTYAAVTTHAILEATSVITLTGDFSWAAVTDADGVVTYPGVAVIKKAAGTGDVGTITKSATALTFVAKTAGVYTVTLTPQNVSKAVVLPKTTFALSSAVKYKRVAGGAIPVSTDTIATAAGAWTLNGANITAYGIPNGATVDSFLWVSNTGTAEGDITVDVTCDGVTTTGISGGTATGKTNTRIAGLVQAAVDAAGTCAATSRYDAAITVNAPVANIAVAAGYKVTAAGGATDRITLETSDSLDGFGS